MKDVLTITNIFYVILSCLSILVVKIIIPLLQQKYSKEKIDNTMKIVDILVKSAEQIYNQSGQGDLRKKYVLEKLKEQGISISEVELDNMIEASVLEINKWKKELKKESVINVINKVEN